MNNFGNTKDQTLIKDGSGAIEVHTEVHTANGELPTYRGREFPKELELRIYLRLKLLEYMDADLKLGEALHNLRDKFPEIKHIPSFDTLLHANSPGVEKHILHEDNGCFIPEIVTIKADRIKQYCDELRQLVPKMLQQDWVLEMLHLWFARGNPSQTPVIFGPADTEHPKPPELITVIRLEMPRYNYTRKGDYLQAASQVWEETTPQTSAKSRRKLPDRDNLDRLVKCVYEQIVHAKTSLNLCDLEFKSRETLIKQMNKTAELLGVQLRQGRIPKLKRR